MGRDCPRGDIDAQAPATYRARPSERPARYIIGLTGNIATGKSAVAHILSQLGARVIDADKVAHQVMAAQAQVKEAIVRTFGVDVLTPQGEIDRSKLASIVFRDLHALRQLEKIVHPAVTRAVDAVIERVTDQVVVVEAIKLIESGLHRNYDAVWVVTAPVEQQLHRLITQRGLTEDEAMMRIEAQPPQAAKVAYADVVIDNAGSLQDLKRQVTAEWLKVVHHRAATSKAGRAAIDGAVVVRRAKRKDIEAIVGLVNSSGWRERPISKADAAQMLLQKGYLLAISRRGAALVGWQTENLVNCADDFYVYPRREAEALIPPLLNELERAARELECEISAVLAPEKGREILRPLLDQSGYEQKRLAELDKIWAEVVASCMTVDQDTVWVKRLRQDRVIMPI